MPVVKSVVPKKIISILADLLTMVSREDLINAINTIPQSAIDAPDDDYESEGEDGDLEVQPQIFGLSVLIGTR